MITSECINCGNCVRECPNEAIYKERMPFELDGVTYPARSEDVHYIVTEKCTDCVGFFFERQCAMVCPVECCVPDPDAVADDAALLAKARYCTPSGSCRTTRRRCTGPRAPGRARDGARRSPALAPSGVAAAGRWIGVMREGPIAVVVLDRAPINAVVAPSSTSSRR